MKNLELARILHEIADILDLQGVSFKPEAYRRAARNLEGMSQDLEDVWRRGELDRLSGVGKAISEKIAEYLETGRLGYYEKLRAEVPAGVVEIMRIPGVGPKTAKLLNESLGIESVEELREAAENGRIASIRGLGPKKVDNILKGIELKASTEGRELLGNVLPLAEGIVEYLRQNAPVESIAVAGSLRRMKETIGDIDILATSADQVAVMDAFVGMPNVKEVRLRGATKTTVYLAEGPQADIRVVADDSFGAALLYFTGSKDHNIQLRSLAMDKGLKLNEYGLFRGEERVASATEGEVYRTLGLTYIEPEMREAQGEVEAAARGDLLNLITPADIRGDLHVHTDWTDGHDSLVVMVEAAKAVGYEYIGISDHSQSVYIAGGMKEEEIRLQMAEVEALRKKTEGIQILHGSEVDILANGEMDYPDDVLRDLDYVIAAVHSRFKMTEKEMTERVIAAMKNEHVDILAHPTCRLIKEREAIELDMNRVIEAAVATHTALEINSFPSRLDLNGAYARAAKELGAMLAIDTDSHAKSHLGFVRYGVGQARKGWVEQGDVINTMSYEDLVSWLRL